MKLYIFFILCAVQVLEGRGFDFKTFFKGSTDKKLDSPALDILRTNKSVENELNKGNFSTSLKKELRDELNSSIFSSSEDIRSGNSNETESSKMLNSTDKSLSSAETDNNTLETSIKSEESSSVLISSSEESSTVNILLLNTTLGNLENGTSSTEESEGVVLTTQPSTFTYITKNFYEKTIEWMGDTYTLSILVPVAAGVLFAVTIILTVAIYKCIRKKCRRRHYRKRVLPDTIKNLRPSDQARLLGDCCDSSDEF